MGVFRVIVLVNRIVEMNLEGESIIPPKWWGGLLAA